MVYLDVVHTRLGDAHPALSGGRVEVPRAGRQVDAHALQVAGWVLGADGPAVAVELVAGGGVVARAPVRLPRPDVADAYPDIPGAGCSGFHTRLTVVLAEPHVDLQVHAVLGTHERISFAAVRLRTAVAARARVSVIIPCYNQAHFLGEALASVAAQSEAASEVIVVDDGSTDNTSMVAGRYPGVQCVRQANAGLAAARNTGLRQATGDYVVFLDADDRLLPSALEVGLTALLARPGHAFTFGAWRLIGADGSVLPAAPAAQVMADQFRAFLRMCFISTPAAVMYLRTAVDVAGGFDPEVSASADYDLYLRLSRRWPVHCHGELVAEYRRHGANMTLDRGRMLASELAVLHRQWSRVRHAPDLVQAYHEGLRRARHYHGGRLAQEVTASAAVGSWSPAVRGALRLLRHHPGALVPPQVRISRRQWVQ